MSKEKYDYKYYDGDGNEKSLNWMIKNRPGWTHSMMAFYRDYFDKTKQQIEQLKAENEQMKLELDKYKSFINKCDPEKLGLFVIEIAKSLNKE